MLRAIFHVAVLLVVLTAAGAGNACAQLIEVPQVVKEAFDTKYPGATAVDWVNNIGKPEVKFQYEGKAHWARFNSKGSWEVTEITVDSSEIPAQVWDGFGKSKYAEWTVKASRRVDKPGGTQYKITASKGTLNGRTLLFSEKGQLLKENLKI